ncbi:hypothetical protein [Vibrio harveyi]|uniref:hypothetical protein n=1 Tax=Vibrio harveyi TaxID=669 RepID=UPI003CF6C370
MTLKIRGHEFEVHDVEEKLLSMALKSSVSASTALSSTSRLIEYLGDPSNPSSKVSEVLFRSAMEDLVVAVMTDDTQGKLMHHEHLTQLLSTSELNVNNIVH